MNGETTTMPEGNYITRRRFVVSAASAAAIGALSTRIIAEPTAAGPTKQKPEGDKMTTLTPYLLFDGNCHEAMEFYQSCFGGELNLTKVKDSMAKDQLPAFQQEKVLNAKLHNGALAISASDWLRPDETRIRGNTVCLYLSGGTFEAQSALFEKLSHGADVTDPLKKQFFGVYGALNDKFGVRWMFVTEK
jgi:PhnB protein